MTVDPQKLAAAKAAYDAWVADLEKEAQQKEVEGIPQNVADTLLKLESALSAESSAPQPARHIYMALRDAIRALAAALPVDDSTKSDNKSTKSNVKESD